MDWITALKREPDRSLALLYDEYAKDAIKWTMNVYQLDMDTASECVQLAYVILYDNVVTGKLTILTASIKTYLYAIIKNKVMQHNRYQQKFFNVKATEVLQDMVAEDYEETDEAMLQKSRMALIELGEPCKTLLELYYYQSMNMEEITQLMAYKNMDTTKNQKYKCMKRLQKLFYA